MLKPKTLQAVLLFVMTLLFLFPACARADLAYDWKVDQVSLGDYQDLYLFSLNMKDLVMETYDEEEEEHDTTGLGEKVTGEIVDAFHVNFSYYLNDVIPLNPSRVIDTSRKSLVADMTLSGTFKVEDVGLLNTWLRQEDKRKAQVHFACLMKDAQTGQTLLELTDTKDVFVSRTSTPFSTDEEFEALNALIEFWARSFAGILSERK